MANHNLDELAKKEGLNSEKVVDYTEVNQGTNSQPRMSEIQTVEPKGTKGKKGKGGRKAKSASSDAPKTIKDKIRCSNCTNLMTQSGKINYEEIEGRKIPKNIEGRPVFKSPGVAQGKIAAVLCDDCKRAKDAGRPVLLNTAVIEKADGTVTNAPVADLPLA